IVPCRHSRRRDDNRQTAQSRQLRGADDRCAGASQVVREGKPEGVRFRGDLSHAFLSRHVQRRRADRCDPISGWAQRREGRQAPLNMLSMLGTTTMTTQTKRALFLILLLTTASLQAQVSFE